MLETRTLTTPTKVESSDWVAVLGRLMEEGWEPAILESERKFMELAGVTGKIRQGMFRRRDPFMGPAGVSGDIFFSGPDVYYVVNATGIEYTDRGTFVIGDPDEASPLEVGVISSQPDGLPGRLTAFAGHIETAIRASLDGRKTRHMTFNWAELKPGSDRLNKITAINQEESETTFAQARLEPDEVKAAELLASKLARELLIELSQAGFAREQDILSRRARLEAEVKSTLEALTVDGLVQTEFLLECKRTSTPLTRLHDRAQLEESGVATLACPSCGSPFDQERLAEGYSVSQLGLRMSRQSYWMTVWVTNILVNLGVPEEAILWNISEHGEEVDLLCEVLDDLWIFELKDREFGAGDAHPLNYRKARYQANKPIIVTTEKVSADAKRVFEELQREVTQTRRRSNTGPVNTPVLYIEGLDAAKDILRREIGAVSLRYAHRRLALVGQLCGYNLREVLAARFGEADGG